MAGDAKAVSSAYPVDRLLDKLEGVRQVAHGRWRARCPAHDGKDPRALSIGEASDGTVLVKCFAGCGAAAITAALGLELSDLFPKINWRGRGGHHARPVRRPRVDWSALILAFEVDVLTLKVILTELEQGGCPSAPDRAAAAAAATRLYRAIQEARDG
jgi:hypothetical protein